MKMRIFVLLIISFINCQPLRNVIDLNIQGFTDECGRPSKNAIYNRLISDYDFLNEIWDGNKGPEDLTNEFSDFFKLSKRGYFLNDFDDSMKNHMYDSPLPPLTALNPIEKMPVKKDQRFLSFILNNVLKRFLVAITCNPSMWKISMKWSEESWRTSKFELYIVYGPYMICSYHMDHIIKMATLMFLKSRWLYHRIPISCRYRVEAGVSVQKPGLWKLRTARTSTSWQEIPVEVWSYDFL